MTALGSGILFSYPEISTIAGVQGLVVYALSSSLPLLIFGFLGPIIRKKCPEGFVLTEWTRQRYGVVTALYLSLLTYLCQALPALWKKSLTVLLKAYHIVFVHGCRTLSASTDHQCIDRPEWSASGHSRVCCDHDIHRQVSSVCFLKRHISNISHSTGRFSHLFHHRQHPRRHGSRPNYPRCYNCRRGDPC